jgi:hypothetical protein
MCVVSMIYDMGQKQRDDIWTPEGVRVFEELVEKARQFDAKTGQPNCEDPKKIEFLDRIKLRARARAFALSIGGTPEVVEAFVNGAEWTLEEKTR